MFEKQTGEEAQDAQRQLLQRIAARDLEALSEFYDQTAGSLFSVAVRILGDTGEAEEVIQDVFVQIWEKAAVFDATLGSAFHWVVSIARHRSIDRLRSRQRRARLVEELQNSSSEGLEQTTRSADNLDTDDVAAVRSALKRLPDDQRQAIEMAFFIGKTHLEIADILQQPLGTIKARIRRGMLKLRENLQEYA